MTQQREMQPRPLDLLSREGRVRLLLGFFGVGGTNLGPMKQTEVNAGPVHPETLQKIWRSGRCVMSTTPEGKAVLNRHRKKFSILEDVDVRAPFDTTIQAFRSYPVVIARRDKNWDRMCSFKLGAKKPACIWQYSLVLEQITTTTDHVYPLIDGELYASGQHVAQCLAPAPSNIGARPRES